MCRARGAERRRSRRDGGAARVDVVHEQHPAPHRARGEGAGDVAAAVGEREPALPLASAHARRVARHGICQCSPSARASRSAGWWPRSPCRRRSAGTNVTTSAAGGGMHSTTSAAASSASRRSPRSFQPATRRRTASSYATAARAWAKASRRPEHSRQRCTGHAVGAPQRSHSGGSTAASRHGRRAQLGCRPRRRRGSAAAEQHIQHVTRHATSRKCDVTRASTCRVRAGRPPRASGCRPPGAARRRRCRTSRPRTRYP